MYLLLLVGRKKFRIHDENGTSYAFLAFKMDKNSAFWQSLDATQVKGEVFIMNVFGCNIKEGIKYIVFGATFPRWLNSHNKPKIYSLSW